MASITLEVETVDGSRNTITFQKPYKEVARILDCRITHHDTSQKDCRILRLPDRGDVIGYISGEPIFFAKPMRSSKTGHVVHVYQWCNTHYVTLYEVPKILGIPNTIAEKDRIRHFVRQLDGPMLEPRSMAISVMRMQGAIDRHTPRTSLVRREDLMVIDQNNERKVWSFFSRLNNQKNVNTQL